MSIEELLARYGLKADELNSWKGGEVDGESASSSTIEETSTATDSASSSTSDSDSSFGKSSSETEDEGLDTDEEPGIEELLSEDEKENLAKNNSMPDVGFVFKFELINCEVLLRCQCANSKSS